MELLLELLLEVIVQLAGELLFAAGLHSVGAAFQRRRRAHPVVAGVGLALAGALLGVVVNLVRPGRILAASPVPGLSLLVSPLAGGLAMEWLGQWREQRGAGRSYLATFWGGALFALAMALVRFVGVR